MILPLASRNVTEILHRVVEFSAISPMYVRILQDLME